MNYKLNIHNNIIVLFISPFYLVLLKLNSKILLAYSAFKYKCAINYDKLLRFGNIIRREK